MSELQLACTASQSQGKATDGMPGLASPQQVPRCCRRCHQPGGWAWLRGWGWAAGWHFRCRRWRRRQWRKWWTDPLGPRRCGRRGSDERHSNLKVQAKGPLVMHNPSKRNKQTDQACNPHADPGCPHNFAANQARAPPTSGLASASAPRPQCKPRSCRPGWSQPPPQSPSHPAGPAVVRSQGWMGVRMSERVQCRCNVQRRSSTAGAAVKAVQS